MPATNYGTTVRPAFSRVRGQLQQRGDLSREAVGGDRDGPLPLLAFEQPMPPLASGHEQGHLLPGAGFPAGPATQPASRPGRARPHSAARSPQAHRTDAMAAHSPNGRCDSPGTPGGAVRPLMGRPLRARPPGFR